MNLTKLIGVTLCAACALGASAEVRYKAVSMGRPAGMEKDVFHVWTAHLNDKGDAAGFLQASGNLPFAYDAPFFYRDGKMTMPQNLGKNFQHDVHGFNNKGVAVGAGLQYGVPERYIPLVWEGNSMRTLPSDRSAVATGISDTGHILGYEEANNNVTVRAVQWVNGVKSNLNLASDLPVTDPFFSSFARSISPNGRFAAGSVFLPNFGGKAVYWEDGIMKYVPGGRAFQAYGVSDSGHIVGEASSVGVSTVSYIYYNGFTEYLSGLGRKYPRALDVNSLGTAVGLGYDENQNRDWVNVAPIVWSGGLATNLNLVTDLPQGVKLDLALSINESGMIAARGERNGLQEMFLLTPVPEPSTFLTCLGLTSILARKRAHQRTARPELREP